MRAADPIPAVREDGADGRTAAIFADLRATLGVPFVNLIWRHLATMPEVLEWAWPLVKPLHGSRALRAGVEALRASVKVPAGVRQPPCVHEAVGVTAADRRVIGAMLRDYGNANGANLLGLLVVRSILEGVPATGRAAAMPVASEAAPAPELPRLPGLDELSPSTLSLVMELDTFGRFAATDAVASLYRHLAHWPGFLAVVHAALAGAHADGMLRAEHARMRDQARLLARETLLPLARPTPPPEGPDAEAALALLRVFTDEMIARMVVMGELMLAVLGPDSGAGQAAAASQEDNREKTS